MAEVGDDIPFLEDDDLERISRMLDAFEGGRLNPSVPTPRRKSRGAPLETKIGLATSDIVSKSTGVGSGGLLIAYPGTGTVDVYSLDYTNTNAMTATGESLTAWNVFDTTISKGNWLILARDPPSGQYFAVAMIGVSGSSSSGSGAGVTVITNVLCDQYGLEVDTGFLTGTVSIGLTTYPVKLSINGNIGAAAGGTTGLTGTFP